MLVADRDADRAAGQVEQLARQVGGVVVERLARPRTLVEADEAQHLGRDRADAAEDVQGHAGRGALADRTQRLLEAGDVDVAGEELLGIVVAEHRAGIPVPVAAQKLELAVERAGQRHGVDGLAVGALAGLDQAAEDRRVGRRLAVAATVQRAAERVERVGDVDRDDPRQRSAARVRADRQRQEGGLVLRVAAVVDRLHAQVERVGELGAGVDEAAVALRGRQEVVEGREVEAVGGRERLEVAGRERRVIDRAAAADGGAQRQVLAVDEEAAERGVAGAAADRVGAAGLAGIGELRDVAVARADRLLLDVETARDEIDRRARPVTPAELVVLGLAVVLLQELAVLRLRAEAVLRRLGDDVDDAGDRVRAVERRRARLEHLDAADHDVGDRVEVDRGGNAAGRGAVDVAQAIDEHERALGTEVAQVDRGRAGADAAAVGRIAEVARIVELRVEAARRGGDALQRVGDRGKAGARDRLLVDGDDGGGLVGRVATDARAGDDDVALGDRVGIGDVGAGLRRCGLRECRQGGHAGDEREGGDARADGRSGRDHCFPLGEPPRARARGSCGRIGRMQSGGCGGGDTMGRRGTPGSGLYH